MKLAVQSEKGISTLGKNQPARLSSLLTAAPVPRSTYFWQLVQQAEAPRFKPQVPARTIKPEPAQKVKEAKYDQD